MCLDLTGEVLFQLTSVAPRAKPERDSHELTSYSVRSASSGLRRAARRAGNQQARSTTTNRSSVVPAKHARIARADAVQERCDQPTAGECRREPDDDTGEGDDASLPHDHPRNTSRFCAEREADTNFSRALSDDVGHGAIDTDDPEHQRHAGRNRQQHHRERHLRRSTVEGVLKRAHLREGKVRVDLTNRAAYQFGQRARCRGGTDHVAHGVKPGRHVHATRGKYRIFETLRIGMQNSSATSRSEFAYGRGFSTTRCTTAKIDAFAAMARASVNTVATVKAGLRNSRRPANRVSCHTRSNAAPGRMSLNSSLVNATLPNSRCAANCASRSGSPASRRSSAASSRWTSSSRSRLDGVGVDSV